MVIFDFIGRAVAPARKKAATARATVTKIAEARIAASAAGFDVGRGQAVVSFRADIDRAARQAAARREAEVRALSGDISQISVLKGRLSISERQLSAEGRTLDKLQTDIERRQASIITRGTIATNRLVLEFNKKAKAFNKKVSDLDKTISAINVKASQSGIRASELGVQLSTKQQEGIVSIEQRAKPLGFDVKATQPFQVSEEIRARARAEQLAIGATVGAGAIFPGVGFATGVSLPVLAGQLAGGFLVGEGARIGAEKLVSGLEPGAITEFERERPTPSIDIRATIGKIEEEFAETTPLGFERMETVAEVQAKKDFVVIVASLIGFAAGARVGGGVVQGVQGILTRDNARILLTTSSAKTGGKAFAKGGKNEVVIKVEKGSFIEKPDGSKVFITDKGFTIRPNTPGRFVSGGRPGVLGAGSTDLGTGLAIIPGFKPTIPTGFSPLIGTSFRPLTAAEAIAATKGIRRVSKKPGVFDIFGVRIEPITKFKRPATTKEAIKFAKEFKKVSPKPGIFDIEGSPIPSIEFAFKEPVTTKEAIAFGKRIRKVSPQPGVFDISGTVISPIVEFKRPATVSEAIAFGKQAKKVSPKPGAFDIFGERIKPSVGFERPQTAKEALLFARGIRKVSPKPGIFDIRGQRIEKPFKQAKFRPLKFRKDFFGFEKQPKPIREVSIFGRRTVTIKRQVKKPIRIQRFIPGSLAALSFGLPRVKKTPTELLFEREQADIFGIKKTRGPPPVQKTGIPEIDKAIAEQIKRGTFVLEPARGESSIFFESFKTPEVFGELKGIKELRESVAEAKRAAAFISPEFRVPETIFPEFAGVATGFARPTPALKAILGTRARVRPATVSQFLGIEEFPRAKAAKVRVTTAQERVQLKTILGISQIQRPRIKVKEKERVDVFEAFEFAPIQAFGDLAIPISIPVFRGAARISERQRERELERQFERITPRQLPRFRERERQRERQRQKEIEKEIPKPKLRALLRPILLEKVKAKRKRVKKVQAFASFVKKKGKLVKVSKRPLRKNTALALGAFLVDNSASQTFRIRKIMGKPRGAKVARPKLKKFRKPIRGGKIQTKSPLFIEKTAFLIDQKGESEAITKRGLEALRKGFFKKKTRKRTTKRKTKRRGFLDVF